MGPESSIPTKNPEALLYASNVVLYHPPHDDPGSPLWNEQGEVILLIITTRKWNRFYQGSSTVLVPGTVPGTWSPWGYCTQQIVYQVDVPGPGTDT